MDVVDGIPLLTHKDVRYPLKFHPFLWFRQAKKNISVTINGPIEWLKSGDAYMRRWTRSTLINIMAFCCYLNQCWLIVNWRKCVWKCRLEMSAMLFRGQQVKKISNQHVLTQHRHIQEHLHVYKWSDTALWFNIKKSCYQYRKSYTGKMSSL